MNDYDKSKANTVSCDILTDHYLKQFLTKSESIKSVSVCTSQSNEEEGRKAHRESTNKRRAEVRSKDREKEEYTKGKVQEDSGNKQREGKTGTNQMKDWN